MKKLKQIKNSVNAYLFDSSINIKDRTFVLFTICMVLGLFVFSVIRVILGAHPATLLLGLFTVVLSILLITVLAKKKKLKAAKILLSVILVLLIRPAAFFAIGGVQGGAPLTFLLGAFYLIMILDGKARILMCTLDAIIYVTCGIVGYYHPELLPELTERDNYVFTYVQFFIGIAVLAVLISFWTGILIKETKEAEEKSKELEELNKSQNRFFSSMSHEIRTPINTVLGMNEIILRQEDASEEIKKDARNIQGAGKLLLALINDILDISKIEAGKMDIVPVNYSVSSLLSEIVNMIWIKAEEKGLKFNVDVDPEVPENLFGDEVRIKQILINLLNNAVKYTKEGSVSLHIECEFPETGEALLKLNISDTGMGIKSDALPHLFDSFQRQDEEKNRHIEGTGLGLSIVKQLVELMDGEIRVSSVYGEGSVFTVEVKQGISSDKRIGDMNIANAGGGSSDEKFEHSFHAPEARILIIDDNEMNLQVESKLLDGTDLVVDLAESGPEALSKTLQYRYDVIFMDHLMPEMDGIECFEKIRMQKGGLNTGVPIIVLTANAGGENIELYNNTGFDGYLVKPVSGRQLEDMLMNHLPPEKVIANGQDGAAGPSMSTASGYVRKKPVVIASSSMCDLPKDLIRNLGISVIPFKVITDEGMFRDGIDIDSSALVRYMEEDTRTVESDPPTVDEFTHFFSSELKKAHHIIYITITPSNSEEYERAMKAASTFENVSVIDSDAFSSSTGTLVMIAARLVQQNLPVEKLVQELEEAKRLLRCSIVIGNTDTMAKRGHISPFMNSILNTLWLRPMLKMKNHKFGVSRFLFGEQRKCYEKYIKAAFPAKSKPDTSFVFISYVGLEEEDLQWIEETLRETVKFEHVIFQEASAGISSNCGPGSFGLLYMAKGDRNYNLGAFFADRRNDAGSNEEAILEEDQISVGDGTDADQAERSAEAEPAEAEPIREWYEQIPNLDAKAAIKNSGSKDAFLSVLKIYYDSFPAKSDELSGYFDSEDWTNYTVKIHALKSSSRLVGALALGDEAEKLEMAGKSGDIEYIKANHMAAMEQYKGIRDSLSNQFGPKEDESLPEIDQATLSDLYEGLSEFAFGKDLELCRMIMGSAAEYRLPSEDADRFKRLGSKVEQMDWDGIHEILKEVNG